MCTEHKWVFFSCFKVCRQCGVANSTLVLDTFNINSAPLFRGYNRRSRFSLKVRKLLGLHSGPEYDDPVWKYLDSQKVTLNSPFDVRAALRGSPLKNKHYDSLRSFCDVFTDFRSDVLTPDPIRRSLLFMFDRMYARWNSSGMEKFFSYAWLLRRFLKEINCSLVIYLKPKTCKRRDIKYSEMMSMLES